MKRHLMTALLAGTTLAAAPLAMAQDSRPVLTQATAKKMADACEQHARAKGWKVIIAIVDTGGVLKQFSRMDDSFMISVAISQTKAHTSAGAPFSSRQWGDVAKANPGLELTPNTAIFAGGMPIVTAGGVHIGGIGVSGATGDQDEECAKVALDAVKGTLK